MHTEHDQLFHQHLLKKPLNQLYVSMAIRSFGISLVALFIPVYLHIQLEYSLQKTLMFFVVTAIFFAIMTPVGGVISKKIGLKHLITLSIPIYIVNLVLLHILTERALPLWILGAIGGTASAFFWYGFHHIFFLISDKKHRGREVGLRISTGLAAAFIGPFIGGVLIQLFGFISSFILAGIALVGSAIFLFMSPDIKTNYHFSVKQIFNVHDSRLAMFYMSRGVIDSGVKVVWPIFIFYILQNYTSLGLTQSLVSVGSILLLFYSGRMSDKISKRRLVRIFSFFEAFQWWIRMFVKTTAQVFGITALGSFTLGMYAPAMEALQYDRGISKKDRAGYFVHREFFLSLGRLLLLLVLLKTGDFRLAIAIVSVVQFFTFLL